MYETRPELELLYSLRKTLAITDLLRPQLCSHQWKQKSCTIASQNSHQALGSLQIPTKKKEHK